MLPIKSFTTSRVSFLALIGALGCAFGAPSCAPDDPKVLVIEGPKGEPNAATDPASDDDAFGERHSPSIAFSPCEDFPEFSCGTLEVPADYGDPDGPKLSLAAVKIPATGARIGSLFVNFGGPGGFQVDSLKFTAARPAFARLRERFDLVTFDPRGTPSSTPETFCNFEPPPLPPPGDDAARAAYLDEHARRYVEACLAQTGPVVTKFGTNNVARDIDLFRAALHDKTLNYFGISYGAELGAAYASLFPKRVRAAILDAAVPDTFKNYLMQAYAEEAAAAELSLVRLDRLCQADPACPMRGASVVDGAAELLARLRENPVPSDDGSVVLDGLSAGTVLYSFLIGERSRAGRIPGFIAAGLEGNYAPWFDFIFPGDVSSDPYLQGYSAILCTDLGGNRPAADFLPLLEAIESTYPMGRYAEFEVLTRTCQAWPASDPPAFRNVANKVKTPILFVGNDFDPATPINWTRNLAHALGMDASFVHYLGGGHTVAFSSRSVPCVDEAAYRYLFDLEVPPEGFTCPAAPITFSPKPAPSVTPSESAVDTTGAPAWRQMPAWRRSLLRTGMLDLKRLGRSIVPAAGPGVFEEDRLAALRRARRDKLDSAFAQIVEKA